MSGIKGGALLLLLGIPFALYAAWQVNGAAHLDAGAPDAPADKTASKEQLAAASAKATAWSGEAKKAVEVSGQYRAAGPADNSADPATAAVVKAASARAADLNDLDRFLSDVEDPKFTGGLKDQYGKWMKDRAALRTDADAVKAWLALPPKVAAAEDADNAMAAVGKLIDAYAGRGFADRRKAAAWRLRARLAVIDALAARADAQYRAAVRVKLPLKPGANEGVVAVATLGGLKAQLAALTADLKQADEDKLSPDDVLRAAIDAKGGGADEYAAREELLALFAKDDLFTNASGAAPWLKSVAAQYAKTKDAKVQALIREKVQEFADAFVPPVARLDDKVLVKGNEVLRKGVVIKFQDKVGGETKREPLSGTLDGANEFNFQKKHPGDGTFVVSDGSEQVPSALKPTKLSEAAVAFNAARAKLADRTTAPRWTAETVAELKKACEGQKDLVDQLRQPNSGPKDAGPKIATRVAGLVAGMGACKELFEVVP